MGFLSDAASEDATTTPQPEAPNTGGFLSDNPPPQETAPEQHVPDWSEIPKKALVNAPESALQFGKNMVQPFIHPIDTATGIKNLGQGVLEKIGVIGGEDHKKYADAVGRMLMDRYGSVDNIKKTLATDPVGVAGDVSMLLTGGETALARLPGIAGKVGEVAGTAGRILDPLNAPIQAAKLTGAIPKALGVTTGAGENAIETAFKSGQEGGQAGQTFRENMRGQTPLDKVVDDARKSLEQMREERGTEYRSGIQSSIGANQNILDWTDVGNAIRDANNVATYKGQELHGKTAATRGELNDAVLDWMALPPQEFHTPEGFDALKRKLGDIRDSTDAGSPDRVVANKYYHAVKNTIEKQVPEYAKVMDAYGDASDHLREIEKTLSLPKDQRKGTIDTSLRKLQSVLRNNVSANFGQRAKLLEYLEEAGGKNLKEALAGQTLNTWAPRGLARVGARVGVEALPAALAGAFGSLPLAATVMGTELAASSPRLVGEAAHGLGRLSRPLMYIPRQTLPIAQQVGRVARLPEMQNRGGAVDRAKRLSKRKDNG